MRTRINIDGANRECEGTKHSWQLDDVSCQRMKRNYIFKKRVNHERDNVLTTRKPRKVCMIIIIVFLVGETSSTFSRNVRPTAAAAAVVRFF